MSDFTDRTLTAIVRKLAQHEGETFLSTRDLEDIVDNAGSTGSRITNATIETDFGDWLITDDGYGMAVEDLEERFDEDPEAYKDFLKKYMYMSDTDIRVYANDYADSVASDMGERDLEDEIDATPSVVKAQEALDDAEEAFSDYEDSDDYDEEVAEGYEEDVSDAEEALEAAKENALDEAREAWSINYADQIKAELRNDAVGYFEDNFGYVPENMFIVDTKRAAEDAVSNDGTGWVLSGYDSTEVEVQVNGKFYQCYRTH